MVKIERYVIGTYFKISACPQPVRVIGQVEMLFSVHFLCLVSPVFNVLFMCISGFSRL